MFKAPNLIHVGTGPAEGSPGEVLASSWRAQGAPPLYDHPQQVSRYAIGSAAPMIPIVRFNGVGYE